MDEEEQRRAAQAAFEQTVGADVSDKFQQPTPDVPSGGYENAAMSESISASPDIQSVPGSDAAFRQLEDIDAPAPQDFDASYMESLQPQTREAVRQGWDRSLDVARREVERLASGESSGEQPDELKQYTDRLFQRIDESRQQQRQEPVASGYSMIQESVPPQNLPLISTPQDYTRAVANELGEDPFDLI